MLNSLRTDAPQKRKAVVKTPRPKTWGKKKNKRAAIKEKYLNQDSLQERGEEVGDELSF